MSPDPKGGRHNNPLVYKRLKVVWRLLVFLLCCGCSVEMLAGAASIVGSYQTALNYEWYGNCLFSYCVVGAR